MDGDDETYGKIALTGLSRGRNRARAPLETELKMFQNRRPLQTYYASCYRRGMLFDRRGTFPVWKHEISN